MDELVQMNVNVEESLTNLERAKQNLIEDQKKLKSIIQKIDMTWISNKEDKEQMMMNLNQCFNKMNDNMIPFITEYIDTMKLLIEK